MIDKAKLVGKEICPGKSDYDFGGIFFSLFLASKKTLFNY